MDVISVIRALENYVLKISFELMMPGCNGCKLVRRTLMFGEGKLLE